jgi:tryptophan synthase alpha chain
MAFETARQAGRIALIPYLTVGYPDPAATLDLVPALAAAGADLVELGIPFSDPLADGPTIQRSTAQALRQGVTVRRCLETVQALRQRTAVPLVFLSYYNPIFRFGLERFVAACAEVGVDGLIVADLPPEESADLATALERYGLALITLLAPTSTDERIARAVERARGFIYAVSLTGVTGARDRLPAGIPELVQRIRRHSPLPVAVGFGLSRPEHVAAVAEVADGAIVGSALINAIDRAPRDQIAQAAAAFWRALRAATGRPVHPPGQSRWPEAHKAG